MGTGGDWVGTGDWGWVGTGGDSPWGTTAPLSPLYVPSISLVNPIYIPAVAPPGWGLGGDWGGTGEGLQSLPSPSRDWGGTGGDSLGGPENGL